MFSSLFMFVSMMLIFGIFWQGGKLGIAPVPSRKKIVDAILSDAPAVLSQPQVIEAGSGWGGLSFALARKYPDAKIIAYEMSWLPYLVSRVRLFLSRYKNISFVRRDFFKEIFSGTGLLVCYLSPQHMILLEPKFKAELKQGARVISSTFPCPNLAPVVVRDVDCLIPAKVFIYDF